MLIRCPQCGTGFNLPDSKIPAKGAKVKCSACAHTFRVRLEDGEPVFFYKKGEQPTGQTMVGAPVDLDALAQTVAAHSDENQATQFGIPQHSKSAREGYNPFPLAGAITGEQPAVTAQQARNDTTQLFGSVSEAEELDDDDLIEDDSNDRTKLGPGGLAEESGDRTSIGAPLANAARAAALRTTDDDRADAASNDVTRGYGSQRLDLFDGELPEPPSEPPKIEIDPFGDAFDAPAGDVGLLMASTPTLDEPEISSGLSLESSSEVSGMSEEDFLLGGRSFGESLALENSFSDDLPVFDPDQGSQVSSTVRRDRPAVGKAKSLTSDEHIELEDVRPDPSYAAPQPASPPVSRRSTPPPSAARPERERPSRPAPAYVHQIGSSSPLRRTLDMVFIGLVVGIAFLALIAARVDGFVDFARFGHMVEVAFTDAEFEPRENWTRIVEIPPPDPPPEEPLRVQNVRAIEKQLDGGKVLVISGRIRNYSLAVFTGVKVKATVEDNGKVVAERIHTVGQHLDRKKFGKAATVEAVKASLADKLPDIGKEGTTYFAIVFDDVPTEIVASGTYDYSVTVAD